MATKEDKKIGEKTMEKKLAQAKEKEESKEGEKKLKKKSDKEVKEEDKTSEKNEKESEKKDKKSGVTLVPLDDYVKYGIHLGTKVITPHMREFVYRRRADSLAVLNTNIIDEKLKKAAEFLAKFKPEDIVVVCKREAGWTALEKFSELTGIRIFTKKYPAGIITNTNLPNFFEVDLIVVSDPWIDKNAMNDAKKINKKVLALCDTNNYTFNADVVIPCNNKSAKSIGLVYYILTREYLKARKIKTKMPPIDDFVGEEVVDKKEEDKKSSDEVEKQIKAKLKMIENKEGV